MYTCRLFVLCESVVLNGVTNNLTMVNVLTALQARVFPSSYARFAFAAILGRGEEPEGPLSLRFVRETESGDEVLLEVGGDSTPATVQFFFNFPAGIRMVGEGTITFRVDAREGESDWYPLDSQVIQVVAPQQQALTMVAMRWFTELNGLVLLHLPKIAAAFAATLLALYGADVARRLKRHIRRWPFLARAGFFVAVVGVVFGAAALLLASAFTWALLLFGRTGALPAALAVIVGLGLLAERKRQI